MKDAAPDLARNRGRHRRRDAQEAGSRARSRPTSPELATVDAEAFGLVVVAADGTIAGRRRQRGPVLDSEHLEGLHVDIGPRHGGRPALAARRPRAFGQPVQLQSFSWNWSAASRATPFINAGAIAVTDVILSGHQPREALGEILRFMQFIAEDPSITIDQAVAASEKRTGFRNNRARQLHEVFRGDRDTRSISRSASISTTAPIAHVVPAARHGGTLPSPIRAATPRRASPSSRPSAPRRDQRLDADLRPLRRLRRVRLPGRPSGQERRRWRHPLGLRPARPRSRCGRRASTTPATPISAGSRSNA